MSHPFHVFKLISYDQQNLYTFSLGLERQYAYFALSKKNIWVTHCTPHESKLLSSPVLCSELLRHVRQNNGHPEGSFMVFLSPFIQTLGYCILCNTNQRTLVRSKMNPEVWKLCSTIRGHQHFGDTYHPQPESWSGMLVKLLWRNISLPC